MSMSNIEEELSEEKEIDRLFGQIIRRRRRDINFSVEKLARSLQVSGTSVSRYELGQAPMTIARFFITSRALSVNPSLLCAELDRDLSDIVRSSKSMKVGLYDIANQYIRLQTPTARRAAYEAVRKVADDEIFNA